MKKNSETEFDEEDFLRKGKHRECNFIVVNEINEDACTEFREDLFRLESADQDIIPVFIDSYGGDVYALYSMLSLIESSNKKIATICDGKAFSCGSILLSAGEVGMRFISPHAYVLVHQVSHEYYGKFSDISVSAEHCAELNSNLLHLLDKNTKNKRGSFERLLIKNNNSDLYIDAKTALQLGIVDHISVPRMRISQEKNEYTELVTFKKTPDKKNE